MRPASPCSHLRDLTRTSESERHLKLDPEPTSEHADRIPVLRPLLPDTGRLLSYLRRIDACRTCTNWGPLAPEFEAGLAAHLDLPSGWVTSAVSGTGALVGAILAATKRSAERLASITALTSRAARDASKVPRSPIGCRNEAKKTTATQRRLRASRRNPFNRTAERTFPRARSAMI